MVTQIEHWLSNIVDLVPLEALQDQASQDLLRNALNSAGKNETMVEALLGLRIGLIDRSHEIVQNGHSSMDKYLHGVIHRLEGDYWNSKYWFRQVDDVVLLDRLGNQIRKRLDEGGFSAHLNELRILDKANRFIPSSFVDAMEASRLTKFSSDGDLLRLVGHAEWESLWQFLSE